MVYGSPTSFCYLQERFCFHVLDGDKEYGLYMLHAGAHSARITFTNNCLNTVWPGTLTADQQPQLFSTGFELRSKKSFPLDAHLYGKVGFGPEPNALPTALESSLVLLPNVALVR